MPHRKAETRTRFRDRLLPALILALAPAASAIPVEVNHPVAAFLRRLDEKGVIAPGFWSTLPRDDREVAAVLEKARENSAGLSAWDRRRLEIYWREFVGDRDRTPLRYEDSLMSVRARLGFYTRIYGGDSLSEGAAHAFGAFSIGVEGRYRENADFVASGTVGSERSTATNRFKAHYLPHLGLPYNTPRKNPPHENSSFDGFRTMIGLGDTRVRIEAGQDWNQWGPGHWQNPTLSARGYFWVQDSLGPSDPNGQTHYPGNKNSFMAYRRGYRRLGEPGPLPQVRFRLGSERWEYVKIVAQRMGLHKDSSAALVAHRLQLRLGNFTFGGAEMLAIGTRRLDALLFVPGVPLKVAEHDASDRDNAAMSGDVEWRIPGHGRLYAELMLDDFSGPPLDFWGNKFSWVVGGSWQDPFGLPSEFHLEYAHVDPWVYGHFLYNTQMQHYGALLGSALPQNSRALMASASFPLSATLEGLVEWRFRQRDLKSPGSTLFESYPNSGETLKEFLERDVETRNELTLSASWKWRHHVELRGGVGGLWVTNWHGHAGESLATPQGYAELHLQY